SPPERPGSAAARPASAAGRRGEHEEHPPQSSPLEIVPQKPHDLILRLSAPSSSPHLGESAASARTLSSWPSSTPNSTARNSSRSCSRASSATTTTSNGNRSAA